jgi:hypothetical protein
MCFNAPVSIASFLLGTAGCILLAISSSLPHVRVMALTWQYSLLMQFVDALAWSNECPQTSITHSAYWLNLTQPIVLWLATMFLPIPLVYKTIASGIAIVYFLYVYTSTKDKEYSCLKTSTCPHLDYAWWWDIPFGGTSYVITIVSIILLTLPRSFALKQVAYVLITLFVSSRVYGCGTPSVWCFFQVLAPLYTYLTIM